ncbi:FlxA-like family protein [Secundilactobacillus similis]|uniref:FlxA-like family protein n=1 Tax=Secundilactobacillus similis TaxID=414682 RepID=UPI0006D0F117|nr:FlxA-like family protein [Secundilactobacillus similis]
MPGSERKKYIYTDYETQSENVKLKNFIETSKVRAELTLSDTLDSKGKNDVVLGVDLFPRGRKYIDSVAYKAKDYTSYLNQLLFNNENDAPTFRQLIGMFVRINMKRDTNGFLHFLDEHVSNDLYLLVYSFLFELSTPEITNSVYSAQNESKNLSNQLKNFKKLNNIRSQDAIKQKIGLLVEEINDIQKQLDGLVDSKRFIENQEKVNEIKSGLCAVKRCY